MQPPVRFQTSPALRDNKPRDDTTSLNLIIPQDHPFSFTTTASAHEGTVAVERGVVVLTVRVFGHSTLKRIRLQERISPILVLFHSRLRTDARLRVGIRHAIRCNSGKASTCGQTRGTTPLPSTPPQIPPSTITGCLNPPSSAVLIHPLIIPRTRVATTRPPLSTPLQAYTTVSPLVPSMLSIPGPTTMPLLPVTIPTRPATTASPIPRTTGRGPPPDPQGPPVPASRFSWVGIGILPRPRIQTRRTHLSLFQARRLGRGRGGGMMGCDSGKIQIGHRVRPMETTVHAIFSTHCR